jgi:hypothetical protein
MILFLNSTILYLKEKSTFPISFLQILRVKSQNNLITAKVVKVLQYRSCNDIWRVCSGERIFVYYSDFV